MLTFEITENDSIEIHADSNGLDNLIRTLNKVAETVKEGDHIHLMSQEWGGDELSDDKQAESNRLIHHVKIMKW